MKRLLNIILIIFLLIAQNIKAQKAIDNLGQLTFFYVHYDIAYGTELHLSEEPFVFSYTLVDSIFTLRYDFTLDSLTPSVYTYILKTDTKFEPELLINEVKGKHDMFLFANKRTFKTDKEYTVYKFARNPMNIDGCSAHFWVPEFGIILVRSSTWGNFRKLRTNDDNINTRIDLLAELIYQNTAFYKGCLEELELLPKDDVQKYYEWKYRNLNYEIKNGR